MAQSQTTKLKRKVSFDTKGDTPIPINAFYQQRNKEELKQLWYSREELMESCNEAKKIVKLIHLAGGKLETIDHTRHCVVGLEKYHLKKEREKYRKLLTRTILLRQQMNSCDDGCLSQISEMMSTSFKDFALWQAALHQFHAYGSARPNPSLISKSIANLQSTSSARTMQGTKRPRQLLLESTFASGIRPTNPLTMKTEHKSSFSATHTKPIVDTSAQQQQQTQHAQNPRLVRNDMMAVMEGYVERKRLRCEVGNLIQSAASLAPSSFATTTLPPVHTTPSITSTTVTTATASKTPLLNERR